MPGRHALKTPWFHILLSLAEEPMHGTAIMEDVLERTGGTVRLWPGMLYGSLRDLAGSGLIDEVAAPPQAPTEGGKRRFWALTKMGRLALHDEVERMAAFVRAAQARGVGGGPGSS